METNISYNSDCIEVMRGLPDSSVNCILTDPPYLYLKNQKLDRPFDEAAFFDEAKRVLKRDGFIVLFGRGTSFYRWNTMLAERGFNFKEEVVWDKQYISSPALPLLRIHETISIHTAAGKINKTTIPFLEVKQFDHDSMANDVKRISSCLNTTKGLHELESYLRGGIVYKSRYRPESVTVSKNSMKYPCVGAMTLRKVMDGCVERDIIKVDRSRYGQIHPTQKPVRLLERLMALVTKPGDTVLDPFAGSHSTAVACLNTDRRYICCEIDKEYYDAGAARVAGSVSDRKLAL